MNDDYEWDCNSPFGLWARFWLDVDLPKRGFQEVLLAGIERGLLWGIFERPDTVRIPNSFLSLTYFSTSVRHYG